MKEVLLVVFFLFAVILFSCAVVAQPSSSSLGVLAFIRDDNIWIKELSNGKPMQLTISGNNERPRWSASSEWLAWSHNQQLWVMRKSGADAKMLDADGALQGFDWSPASDTLAYTTPNGDLRVASAPAWQARESISGSTGKGIPAVLRAAWSPDGQWLAVARQEALSQRQPGQPFKLAVSIWRMRADGSDAKQVFALGAPAEDGLDVAGWSQDSQSILFSGIPFFSGSFLADGVPLQAIPANGGTPRKLTESMLLYSDFRAGSPDDKSLAITEGGGRETWSHKRIVVVNVSNGASTQLTDDVTSAFSPAWSPDGRRIAYVAAPDIGFVGGGNDAQAGATQRRIWIMRNDGSDKRQLTNDANYRDERPLWSADGQSILFARLNNATNLASLWLIPFAGGEPRQVVDGLPMDPQTTWFGYYGHIGWDDVFDWWTGATPKRR